MRFFEETVNAFAEVAGCQIPLDDSVGEELHGPARAPFRCGGADWAVIVLSPPDCAWLRDGPRQPTRAASSPSSTLLHRVHSIVAVPLRRAAAKVVVVESTAGIVNFAAT
jgi:hypothetical protein